MWDRLHRSMRHWGRLVAKASEGARAVEREGALATVVPAAPERAVANAVLYEHVEGLRRAYDEFAAGYEEIGAKWTVWVHHEDERAAAFLRERGHVLDAEPLGMARDLVANPVARPTAGEPSDWTAGGSIAELAAINDRSYSFDTDSFARALARMPEGAAHIYVARVDRRPAGCLAMVDDEANSEVEMVAVVPEARGRGLAAGLLRHALADAVERGNETSTLVATRLGRPVYERLGFQVLGPLQMWERDPR
jgi:GNAT superfamily N-acetyltransferase